MDSVGLFGSYHLWQLGTMSLVHLLLWAQLQRGTFDFASLGGNSGSIYRVWAKIWLLCFMIDCLMCARLLSLLSCYFTPEFLQASVAPEFVQPLSSFPVSLPGTVAHLPEPCPSEIIYFKAPIFHGSLLVFVSTRGTEPIGYMHSYIGLPNRKWNSQSVVICRLESQST